MARAKKQNDKSGEKKKRIKYTEEIGDKICELTATSNMSLKSVCEKLGLNHVTVSHWIYCDNHSLASKYARAKQQQADFLAEEILEISDKVLSDSKFTVEKAKLQVDARKFVAAKLKPKKYGDRPELFLTAEAENAEKTDSATIAERLTRLTDLIAQKNKINNGK